MTTGSIKIKSTRFGDIEAPADKLITFHDAIPGFPGLKRYVILDHDPEGLFKWLQSIDDPAIAFLLTIPSFFKADYALPEKTFPIASIGADRPEDAVVMAMVCVTRDKPPVISLNLKGPIVFNHNRMTAVQYIVDREDYPCDYKIRIVSDEGRSGSAKAN